MIFAVRRPVIRLLFLPGVIALAIACSRSNPLQSLNQAFPQPVPTTVSANFCTDPAAQSKSNSKLIIILDHSNSNKENYIMASDGTVDFQATQSYASQIVPLTGINFTGLATDPLGKTRYGDINTPNTLLNYLYHLKHNDPANPNQFFALINFNKTASVPYPYDPTTGPVGQGSAFTTDTACFYGIVQADALGRSLPCSPSGPNAQGDPNLYTPDKAAPASVPGSTPAIEHPNDSQGTSYIQPLMMASNLISNDINQALACSLMPVGPARIGCPNGTGVRVSSSYVIVFMTDGTPSPQINITPQGANLAGCTDPALFPLDPEPGLDVCIHQPYNDQYFFWVEPASGILNQVKNIMKLKSANTTLVNGINLYTVYYYYSPPAGTTPAAPANVPNIDPNSKSILTQMATTGSGFFYNVASGSNINYGAFLPPTQTLKYTLSDVFVTNSSVAWWTDGKQYLDSDMDGLPDAVETAWGSDPKNSHSLKNGISDLVRFQLRKSSNSPASQPVPCAANAVSYTTTPSGDLAYTASSPDGLNDCEKVILNAGADEIQPDSNGDLIPDWLEFKNLVPFQNGYPISTNINLSDGYSLYQKIKYSLPTSIAAPVSLGFTPSSYDLDLISSNSVQDCYQLTVTGLPFVGDNNSVRLDILLKSPQFQSDYIYHRGIKVIPKGSNNLKFNDWTDATEQSSGTWSAWP